MGQSFQRANVTALLMLFLALFFRSTSVSAGPTFTFNASGSEPLKFRFEAASDTKIDGERSHAAVGTASRWIYNLTFKELPKVGQVGDAVFLQTGRIEHLDPQVANHMGEGDKEISIAQTPAIVAPVTPERVVPIKPVTHSENHQDSGYVKISGPVNAVDMLKFDSWNASIRVTHTGPVKPAPNGNRGAPEGGDRRNNGMSFDAATDKLSFTSATIDSANLVGNGTLDPAFANDPILGATISVTNLALAGPAGSGFLFTGGSMNVTKGGTTFLSADIPELLIQDRTGFEFNWWAPLVVTDIAEDFGGSKWLEEHWVYSIDNPIFPAELMGQTEIPVTELIGNGESFAVATSEHITSSVPEPSPLALWGIGALGMLGYGMRRISA